jgi:5'-nucleotidase
MSPALYTISGTMGATYSSVYRGLPAVAFSGSNTNNSLYVDNLDLKDNLAPSTIYAEKTTQFVNQLFASAGDNIVLPIGVGINVNYPKVGYESKNEACVDPKWTATRLTGQYARGLGLTYNETSNMFTYTLNYWKPLTVCANGDCSLPSENTIVEHTNCQAAYSVFNIDYDANTELTKIVDGLLAPLSK